jgi:hypothetical protein
MVAHHGGELPALVGFLSGGIGVASVALVMVRHRLARFFDRRQDAGRWRT